MRPGDISRTRGVLKSTKTAVQDVQRRPVRVGQSSRIPPYGIATVVDAVAVGGGSVCDIVIDGMFYAGAQCRGAVLSIGSRASYVMRGGGAIELATGGGGVGSSGGTTQVPIFFGALMAHSHSSWWEGFLGVYAGGR
jgi:hypothetical protein